MSDELTSTLLSAVVNILVKAVTTGLWESVRDRIASILSRGDQGRAERVRKQLDEPGHQTDPALQAAELRGTVRALLADTPAAEPELRQLVAELTDKFELARTKIAVLQTASATRRSTVHQAGRDLVVRDDSRIPD